MKLDRFGVFYLEDVPAKEIVMPDGRKESLPPYKIIQFDPWSRVKNKEKELLAEGGVVAAP